MNKYYSNLVYTCFLAPALILFMVFCVIPVIIMIPISAQDHNGIISLGWVGLKNLLTVFSDGDFWNCIVNVLKVFIVNVIFLVYSWIMAFRLSHEEGWLNRLFRFAAMFPMVLSVTAVGKYGTSLFGLNGLINDGIEALGYERISFLSTKKYTMWVVGIVSAWWGFGSGIVGRYAAIKRIPNDLVEAAYLDGASEWQMDFHIRFPLMSSHHSLTIIATVSSALMTYALTSIMASGLAGNSNFDTPVSYIVNKVSAAQYGSAAAYSLIFFIICVGISMLVQKFCDFETYTY